MWVFPGPNFPIWVLNLWFCSYWDVGPGEPYCGIFFAVSKGHVHFHFMIMYVFMNVIMQASIWDFIWSVVSHRRIQPFHAMRCDQQSLVHIQNKYPSKYRWCSFLVQVVNSLQSLLIFANHQKTLSVMFDRAVHTLIKSIKRNILRR